MEKESSTERIAFANTLRGFACLLVVCAHYCGTFWFFPEVTTLFSNLPTPSPAPEVPYLFQWVTPIKYFNPGPLGVAIFFLISGFVIPISLSKQNPVAFLISRFFRIVPTYAVGLMFTVGVLAALAAFAGVARPFTTKEVLLHLIPGLRDFFNSRNIDGIIWTLEVEMKFYVLCALFCAIGRKIHQNHNLASILWVPYGIGAIGLMLSAFHSRVPTDLVFLTNLTLLNAPFLVFMFIGVALYLHYTQQIRSETAMFFGSSLLGLTLLLSYVGPYSAAFPSFVNYGLAVILFVGALAFPQWTIRTRLTDVLSKVSYPLYVVHGVAGYAIMRTMQSTSLSPYLMIGITFAIVFSVSVLIHHFIEAPTQRFGKMLSQKLFPRPLARFTEDTSVSIPYDSESAHVEKHAA